MKQMTFADAEYAGKRKQTRKELFLIEMDRVVPWKGLISLDYAIGWGLDNRWVVGVGGYVY
jgi:IS5 family transposase